MKACPNEGTTCGGILAGLKVSCWPPCCFMQTAFRSKAKQYHPDQNQENKDVAEARFREVMTSYEAIKSERKNSS